MANLNRQTPIVPGPCPVIGDVPQCPPPNEIVCISVDKVFDFCFESDTFSQCFTIPAACGTVIPAGAVATCSLASSSCSVVSRTAAPPPAPVGFFNVQLQITVNILITIRNADGTIFCSFTAPFIFNKTVILYAPVGTSVDCLIANFACSTNTFAANQICLSFQICLIVEVIARVFLLVPAYGYCTPAPCNTQPGGFVCPPDLFPPEPPPRTP